ncbi:MAG: dienelactone hydrolase family protein, partial [Aeromicrobium sp.]|nr:dienelactone hydrolase family protein [Burkholderiales bacterium]
MTTLSGNPVTFKRPDGGTTNGYLAMAGAGKPGVVVI